MSEPATKAGAPPRKRRRPALSCAECRRRKIKCDRNIPCRQCTQSKSATCTYSPERLSSVNSHANRVGGSLSNSHGPSTALEGAEAEADKSNLFFLNPEVFPVDGVTPPTPSSSSHSYAGSQPDHHVVQTLVDRVEKLESMLAATSLGGKDGSASCRTKIPAKRDLDRNFWHKTRCYGQSHWMHPFEQVRRFELSENLILISTGSKGHMF